jgi:hypothetical protein
VLVAQCLGRRIESIEQLAAETAAWEQQRNAVGARIKWMFTTEKAPRQNGPGLSDSLWSTQVRFKESKPLCSAASACVLPRTHVDQISELAASSPCFGLPRPICCSVWPQGDRGALGEGRLRRREGAPHERSCA